MKYFTIITLCLLSFQSLFAGCGSCKVSKKNIENTAITSSPNFATSIAKDGSINGLVLASCGMCNFGMKNQKSCSLSIKVGEEVYSVQGSKIDDHGDSHAKDGFCNAVRVANVDGKVVKGIFRSENFALTKN